MKKLKKMWRPRAMEEYVFQGYLEPDPYDWQTPSLHPYNADGHSCHLSE